MLNFRLGRKKIAFTLIELSVVIAIITVLASISIPNVNRYLMKSRDAKRISDIQVLSLAIESFYDDQGHYPGWNDTLTLTPKLGDNGECVGVVGRTVGTDPCASSISGGTNRVDGALDVLLKPYIQGAIPRDPSYDNQPNNFYYGYDPHHEYVIPTAIAWSDTFPTANTSCSGLMYPHAGWPGVANNTTAVLSIRRFESDTIHRHRDTCRGATLYMDTSDYNIAFPNIGYGSGLGNL
ncbi:MAG: prepilin-type N-terminal cleavage/methylation domain-containing protein [Candidatus Omnitrophica bacterium]|nr:prepilin-type N-terminal cleavage/methylation domain-containing protein [Candidatus Omnitrophota bacterium]MBU2044387.1 prepilin-type N-terminal cleavage/methylation domain-containing protein [Candidatus Omnitrophota bacterium]MBU2251436.1 prepilin-type N-terminal cleavage/methylation domain-containing protein [Candidatus Omnitrophota bacterium]MBU2474228.1 prepilin-type N-terminal cleavage/methylation domain-containing protein [Candidatus Omnitrophota bacterium]